MAHIGKLYWILEWVNSRVLLSCIEYPDELRCGHVHGLGYTEKVEKGGSLRWVLCRRRTNDLFATLDMFNAHLRVRFWRR